MNPIVFNAIPEYGANALLPTIQGNVEEVLGLQRISVVNIKLIVYI
jgi:hypothetical protein